MLNAKLVVVGGDAKSGEVRLKLPTVIGRGKESGLTVPHALVSRRHTEIFEKEGRLFVRDLGSLNGTFVNDRRIESVQPLDPNQLLTLGNVTFRAVYELNQDTQAEFPNNETVEFEDVTTEVAPRKIPNEIPNEIPQTPASAGQSESQFEEIVASAETTPVDLILKSAAVQGSANASDGSAASEGIEGADNVLAIAEQGESASQSVSVSAIDQLPETQPDGSFNATIDVGEGGSGPDSKISKIEIDLGEEGKAAEIVGDSGLGSFLNKFPR